MPWTSSSTWPAPLPIGRSEPRIRDPGIRAIIATKAAKRISNADGLDFAALAADPNFSSLSATVTILHLAIWKNCRLPGIHGAPWDDSFGAESAASFFTLSSDLSRLSSTAGTKSQPSH